LSDWQWRRLHERQAYNLVIEGNIHRTVTNLQDVLTGSTEFDSKSEWITVQLDGHWDAAHQVLVRKKSFESDLGFWVVTPFVSGNNTIMVNRGWIIAGNSSLDTPTVQAPPQGDVKLQGRLRILKTDDSPQPSDLPVGQVDRIVPTQITQATGVITNGYFELVQSEPNSIMELKTMPAPEISEGPHRSYALQWIFFGIMTILGWIILVRNEAIRQQTDDDANLSTDRL
jgi:cytochrome oxidase assembly protein ShyY1